MLVRIGCLIVVVIDAGGGCSVARWFWFGLGCGGAAAVLRGGFGLVWVVVVRLLCVKVVAGAGEFGANGLVDVAARIGTGVIGGVCWWQQVSTVVVAAGVRIRG